MSKIIKSARIIETTQTEAIKQEDYIANNDLEDYMEKSRLEYERVIAEAEKESEKIIEAAEELGESITNDAFNRAKGLFAENKSLGYKEGYDIGFSEGYNVGYDEGKTKSDRLISESLELKDGYILTRNNLIKELEEDIIQLVINIYEKVINEKTDQDNEMIISLVLNGITNLDYTEELTIISSKEDFHILEMSRSEILAKASMISKLDLKYDSSFKKGDCILETPKGNIDISVKNQLAEVKDLLTTILNNE